jgi:hypothetical protein
VPLHVKQSVFFAPYPDPSQSWHSITTSVDLEVYEVVVLSSHQPFFPEGEKPFPGNNQMIMHQDIKEFRAFLKGLSQPDVGV